MAQYLINMNDGRIVFRNRETDAQINLRPVSQELVDMIVHGEVKSMDVVNAISAKIKENGDFNLAQYVEDMKKLNVRKSNPQGVPDREELKDRSSEEVSLAEVKSAAVKTGAKKERIKKINAVIDAEIPDVIKSE